MEKEIKEFLEQHFNHTVDNYEFDQEDMNKLRDIIFNLDSSLQRIESRLDLLEDKKGTVEEP